MPDQESSAAASERINLLIAEFLERRERGEEVDEAQFLATHPQYAEELRSFFAGLDLFDQDSASPHHPLRERPTFRPRTLSLTERVGDPGALCPSM